MGRDAVPVFFGKSEGEGHDDGTGVGDRFELYFKRLWRFLEDRWQKMGAVRPFVNKDEVRLTSGQMVLPSPSGSF